MTETAPALAFEDVSKRFGRIQAVDHLSIQVEPGRMAGFLGPNGAGKSTSLFMIPRLVRPSSGAIRATLAAPVHRWELYLAKAATGLVYMVVLSAATLLASVALAKTRYDFCAIGDQFGVVYGRGAAARTFLLAYVLSWVPLSALVMYGLFVSTIVRSPGAAVAVGISVHYLADFAKHLVGLDPCIFTRHVGYPWLILQQVAQGVDYQWQPEVWKMLGLSGAYAAAAFGAGLILFQRQDLNE